MAAVYKAHEDIAMRLIEAGATPHIQDGVSLSFLVLLLNLFFISVLVHRTAPVLSF